MAEVLEKLQLKMNSTDLTINDSQHAFTRKRSTVFALAYILQKAALMLRVTHVIRMECVHCS